MGAQASPDGPVRYFHKDYLKPCPAPVPEPIWPMVLQADEIFLLASLVPPETLHRSCQPGASTDALSGRVGVPCSNRQRSAEMVDVSRPVQSGPGLSQPDVDVPGSCRGPVPDKLQHPLDWGIPRHLDYKGLRFPTMDSLYLVMMVERLGFGEKLQSIVKHKKLSTSVTVAVDCCKKASLAIKTQWNVHRLTVLRDILCHCCLTHPRFLDTLRQDADLVITELHREALLDLTPSTFEYTHMCRELRKVALTFLNTTSPGLD